MTPTGIGFCNAKMTVKMASPNATIGNNCIARSPFQARAPSCRILVLVTILRESHSGLVIVSLVNRKTDWRCRRGWIAQGKKCLSLCEVIDAFFGDYDCEAHARQRPELLGLWLSEYEHINTTRSIIPISNSYDESSKAFYREPTSAITEYSRCDSQSTAGLAPTPIC